MTCTVPGGGYPAIAPPLRGHASCGRNARRRRLVRVAYAAATRRTAGAVTLPGPPSGRRGLSFRLLGFPVTIDATFLGVITLLGLNGELRLDRILVWLAIGTTGVLVHELAHAVVA